MRVESDSPLGDATIAADLLDDDEAEPVIAVDPTLPGDRFLDRELSWLAFNQRVLELAEDDSLPLLERANFLAIFASNLDEFFMKRVGLLKRRIASGRGPMAPGELPPRQVLTAVRRVILDQVRLQADAWQTRLRPELADAGIHVLNHDQLDKHERARVDDWFAASVFPILTPLAVDPGHRFPFISNLSENLGVLLDAPGSRELKFARVKIPDVLPQFVRADNPGATLGDDPPVRLIALDDLVRHNLAALFPGMRVVDVMPFRLTRSASLELEDEEEDDGEEALGIPARERIGVGMADSGGRELDQDLALAGPLQIHLFDQDHRAITLS